MQSALADARVSLPRYSVVVNVRRGDYYSVPRFHRNYGMDIKSYVQSALSEAAALSNFQHVRIVSDDPQWCRENLRQLEHYGSVDFGPDHRTPMSDLAVLSTADTLVLANSTFSYWGAYINGFLHRNEQSQIWAPRFHARFHNHGNAWQLDPQWNVIESLPGGWASPEAAKTES
ncbi:alpha-1,2-fucosyltransferase [Pseudarthrobacter sp. C1]|uniref:alpha-1,2-fucosyltransferase n=1 Tax=Pseudarthrobacter sp. C1 TaxID=3108940 RepID=UPI002B061DCB|nr:alpha-1,2-fucosyltransferase [Pseudarthrobacter sp. C1]MEA3550262.1 alpha-1,2-fucosyltransferase [Pseudarthrobacter sp. C1]